MFKSLTFFTLAAAVFTASAQSPNPADTAPQATPAPIVRGYHSALRQPLNQVVESQPVSGVWLRSESSNAMTTISATPQRTEIRLDRGRLNVNVHHPADHGEILIDLPGGQVSLLKDGLYTFNADTGTVRVLHGEAAYLGTLDTTSKAKPIKIKEDHQLSLVAAGSAKVGEIKPVEAYPYELAADLLPLGDRGDRGYVRGYEYGDGYPYPYYAGGYGYPYGYPGYFGYGYPFAYGIGFGYYGGFGSGYGFRGGFRR